MVLIISSGEKFRAIKESFLEIITFSSKPSLLKFLIEKSFRFHWFISEFQVAFFESILLKSIPFSTSKKLRFTETLLLLLNFSMAIKSF